jgi:hypothetical protein
MAKDHGAEFLYKQMRDCAKATHYYVVKTMMRWKLPGYKDRPPNQKWVNWLELLEYFLCNPTMNAVCPVPKQVPVPIIHKLDEEDTQFSIEELWQKLYERFKPDSLDLDDLTFSPKTIFDWNTLTRVKKSVTQTANEKWFPEIGRISQLTYQELKRVVIPLQKHNLAVCNPATVGERWFIPVILTGWNPGINLRHTIIYHPDQAQAQTMATDGEELRQTLINLYRPAG